MWFYKVRKQIGGGDAFAKPTQWGRELKVCFVDQQKSTVCFFMNFNPFPCVSEQ